MYIDTRVNFSRQGQVVNVKYGTRMARALLLVLKHGRITARFLFVCFTRTVFKINTE